MNVRPLLFVAAASVTSLVGCEELVSMVHAPFAIATIPSRRTELEKRNVPSPISGIVVDEQDNELPGAQLHVTYSLNVVTELGSNITPLETTRPIGARFTELIPGNISRITVSHDGYYAREYYVSDNDAFTLATEGGHDAAAAPALPHNAFRIQLRKHGQLTDLERHLDTAWVTHTGAGVVFNPAKPDTDWDSVRFTTNVERAPDGYLFVTTTRDARGIPTLSVNDCECPRHYPENVRIGIAGPGNGLQLYAPTSENNAWFDMRRAPDIGYQAEIALPQDVVQHLAQYKPIYFFVKCGNRFGRGTLSDGELTEMSNGACTRYGLRIRLEMQPDGTNNLEQSP